MRCPVVIIVIFLIFLPGKPLLAFFTSLSDAMMVITTWVINLAPIGVFFLIGGQVREFSLFSFCQN